MAEGRALLPNFSPPTARHFFGWAGELIGDKFDVTTKSGDDVAGAISWLVVKALRVVIGLATALITVGCIAAALWLMAIGRPPPFPTGPPDSGQQGRTEPGVAWVPGIGSRAYGNCTRILSIDGGGVRGLVPALMLAEIERRTGRPIFQHFDLVVGTSTGAILALGLTRPSNADARQPAFSAQDLVQFYREQATHIFPRSFAPLRYMRRVFRPKFDPDGVERIFERYFEDVRLVEALTNCQTTSGTAPLAS